MWSWLWLGVWGGSLWLRYLVFGDGVLVCCRLLGWLFGCVACWFLGALRLLLCGSGRFALFVYDCMVWWLFILVVLTFVVVLV